MGAHAGQEHIQIRRGRPSRQIGVYGPLGVRSDPARQRRARLFGPLRPVRDFIAHDLKVHARRQHVRLGRPAGAIGDLHRLGLQVSLVGSDARQLHGTLAPPDVHPGERRIARDGQTQSSQLLLGHLRLALPALSAQAALLAAREVLHQIDGLHRKVVFAQAVGGPGVDRKVLHAEGKSGIGQLSVSHRPLPRARDRSRLRLQQRLSVDGEAHGLLQPQSGPCRGRARGAGILGVRYDGGADPCGDNQYPSPSTHYVLANHRQTRGIPRRGRGEWSVFEPMHGSLEQHVLVAGASPFALPIARERAAADR